MKASSTFLVAIFLILTSITAFAQTSGDANNQWITSPSITEQYGSDILIQPNSSEDQTGVRISTAFNGWIYASYLISSGGYRVARSTDNGLTWTYSATLRTNFYLSALDLVVTGTDLASLKVWVVNSGFMTNAIDIWEVCVQNLNSDLTLTGTNVLDQIFSNYGYFGVAIASDYKYPSNGANPFSLGVLYSKDGNAKDSVIFRSSGNGGVSFDNHKAVAAVQNFYGSKVALAFGRSQSYPEGRYFAVWHEAVYWDPAGKIFTAHSDLSFNGSWTAPVRVDVIPPNAANTSKNPVISCQANNTDNNAMDFTTVILFERYDASAGKYGIVGVFNTNSTTSNTWLSTEVSNPVNSYDIQPDITFDADYNDFYTTWCDSISQQLNCSYQGFNLPTPNAWSPFSTGYNDNLNLQFPFPRIAINQVTRQVVNVWTGQVSGMAGNATFDGGSIYVNIPETTGTMQVNDITVSPNPCKTVTSIGFQLNEPSVVSLFVYDIYGVPLIELPKTMQAKGRQSLQLNVENLKSGLYIFELITGNQKSSGRISIIR